MAETQLVMFCLTVMVVFMACGLVAALWRVTRLANKCIDHALAESINQREIMRLRFEAEHQEFLLREARNRDKRSAERYPSPATPEGEPDILVATRNGNLG